METEVLAETESVPPDVQDAELPPVALEENAEVEQLDCRFWTTCLEKLLHAQLWQV